MTDSSNPLGELKSFDDKDATVDEILCSQHAEDRVKQSIRFVVQTATAGDTTLVLCWVDAKGALCHHYTYDKSRMDHDECSYIGDAFVVYETNAGTTQPHTLQELVDDDAYTVVCSYRLSRAVKEDHIHLIRYNTDDDDGTSCSVTDHAQDFEYRILVGLSGETQDKAMRRLPIPTEPWEVIYQYTCPPVPSSPGWDPKTHTFYVWGDMDFDDYGHSHRRDLTEACRGVHPCVMNQIVPQVMIGNCLASSTSENGDYKASWTSFDSWVMQAQYFFQDEMGKGRALCGEVIHVDPGDAIHTRIAYDPTSGVVTAVIKVLGDDDDKKKRSEIRSERPFPHNPELFRDWKDFFLKCQDAEVEESITEPSVWCSCFGTSGASSRNRVGPLGRPYLNVEYKGRVDLDTLRSICPFKVQQATYPGVDQSDVWKAQMFCPRLGRCDKLYDDGPYDDLELKDALVLEI